MEPGCSSEIPYTERERERETYIERERERESEVSGVSARNNV